MDHQDRGAGREGERHQGEREARPVGQVGRASARSRDGRDGRDGRGESARSVHESAPPPAQPSREPHEQQYDPRPDQVELFLHREGPQVVERRRRGEPRVVGGVLADVPPVAHVEHRRDDVTAEPGDEGPGDHVHPDGDDRQHHEQRGQQPPRPPQPEVAELDPPARRPLPDQDVGDEVAAQREEHADPEQPALRPAVAEVIGDHRRHGERAQPVEPRQILLVALHRFRHDLAPSRSLR